jgi:2',3'-cyclic-nucleotide 2'-phosphodiesterase (5'-nucleotidase family)
MPVSQNLDSISARIRALAADDNLAAVLIQFNDTYIVDERRDAGIPGMARLAGLAESVRNLVRECAGEDRTLVLHSGDYLSPSYLTRQLKGEPLPDLLNRCAVDLATIGNHEFDFGGDVLKQRLSEARFRNILANMQAPDGYSFESLVLWPQEEPFIAITGLAGIQTRQKAEECGFRTLDMDSVVEQILDTVRADSRIGALVILSHMGREEDKALQKMVSSKWHRDGFVYLLGGHDHDIFWRERDYQNCFLSKCLSNAKSVTLFLVPKDGLVPPGQREIGTLRVYPSEQEEYLLFESERRFLEARRSAFPADPLAYINEAWMTMAPSAMRADFLRAFDRRIEAAFQQLSPDEVMKEFAYGGLTPLVVGVAASQAYSGFVHGAVEISGDDLFSMPVQPDAAQAVAAWVAKLSGSADDDVVVADLSTDAPNGKLDGSEASLRTRSTDFGNFAADAIRAATEADFVLLNSGAFRFDGPVPARIRRKDLRDMFLFDAPDAVLLTHMDWTEVRQLVEYGKQRAGHGAFPQVSDSDSQIRSRAGKARVALIRHMLKNDEDGYRSQLAGLRGVASNEVMTTVETLPLESGSLIDLIVKGASSGVAYSDERRLSGVPQSEFFDEAETRFVELTDQYRNRSNQLGIPESQTLDIIFGVRTPPCPETLVAERERLIGFVFDTMNRVYREHIPVGEKGFGYFFYVRLCHSAHHFRNGLRYQDYFDRAYSLVLDFLQRKNRP